MKTQLLDFSFPSGHASAPSWREAAKSCLEQCGRSRNGASLGFVYATDHFAQHLKDIRDYLKSESGVAQWVGTVGVGICANGKEYFDRPALSVMLCEFDPRSFTVLPSLSTRRDVSLTSLRFEGGSANFAIVHADAATPDLAAMIKDLSGKLDSGFVVGALSSSRSVCPQIANEVLSGGMSGVVFSDDVIVSTRLTQGCAPIGPRRTITRSFRNIIITIDGRPALEVLREDLGTNLSADLDLVRHHIFAGLPVTGSDTHDYLVRHLAGMDANRQLIAVADQVEAGGQIFFCTRDKASASDDLERMLQSMKSGLYRVPRGAVYFSCLGRGPNLFGADSEELRIIRDHLGEIPLVGFFGNGEISHDRLYGYTGVLTVFL